MNPLVSFAITVKDEVHELVTLIDTLDYALKNVAYPYEIVVLVDGDVKSASGIDRAVSNPRVSRVVFDRFEGDFAAWKNKLNSLCRGDYILQLDADELPPDRIVLQLDYVLKENRRDLVFFPRLNVVSGITPEDIARWRWEMKIIEGCDVPVVNFPDYQGRLYRNAPEIKWEGLVHERIVGFKSYAYLQPKASYAIAHIKSIERQREQNDRYARMIAVNLTGRAN